MENFEKCTIAMTQHVTGNTSRQNQPQSAMIGYCCKIGPE